MPQGAKISIVILMTSLFLSGINAQERSIGATFSYAGTGISFQNKVKEDTFIEIQLRAETTHLFASVSDIPGMTASVTWNMTFAEMTSPDGNRISFFAGPGISAGFADDIPIHKGVVFGLKGRVGVECCFNRNIALSACVSPVIGAHVSMKDGIPYMLFYKTGMMNCIMPEVGIRYIF